MGFLGEEDLDAMLADLAAAGGGVDVTLGANTVTGLRDSEAQELLGGESPGVTAVDEAVHVKSGLAGLVPGAAITVDGTGWVVRDPQVYGDGAMTRILLRKP